eukprot:2250708-Pleurochrysis_carterae.AAC.1
MSTVPNTTSTLCAICAGVLTLADVTLIKSDHAAARLTPGPNDPKLVSDSADKPSSEPTNSRIDAYAAPAASDSTDALDEPADLQVAAAASPAPSNGAGIQKPADVELLRKDENTGIAESDNERRAEQLIGRCNEDGTVAEENDAGNAAHQEQEGGAGTGRLGATAAETASLNDASGSNASNESANVGGVDPPSLVGMRVHKKDGYASYHTGLVYSEVGEQFSVAFDDGRWQAFPREQFAGIFE